MVTQGSTIGASISSSPQPCSSHVNRPSSQLGRRSRVDLEVAGVECRGRMIVLNYGLVTSGLDYASGFRHLTTPTSRD